ncbi:MAG: LON peptidase substrate-binding domain-containing protein [Gammaproteobacteria bacterium]|nr:LON peptidase substrate-binding domain-containing protein [Gammaproteobacteria bacterium]
MNELPLFPLRTVLFPGGLLPLRIFEPRYVDMVGRCMREGGEFGVLLITDAASTETGALGALAAIGTTARVVDFNALPDGLLGLMCRGARRFRLLSRRTQEDGLHLGTVEWLAEHPPSPLQPQHAALARVLRRVLEELGDTARHLDADFGDAGWVSWRLAEFLPLERSAQQQLLELEDPQARMRALAPLIEVPPEDG